MSLDLVEIRRVSCAAGGDEAFVQATAPVKEPYRWLGKSTCNRTIWLRLVVGWKSFIEYRVLTEDVILLRLVSLCFH